MSWRDRPTAITIGLLAAILALLTAHGRVTPYDNYVLFAQSLLHGHLNIDDVYPGPSIDAVLRHGHRYIVNDPVPAFLMLPLVAAFGLAANETMVACLLCGLAAGAAWTLFSRLGVSTARSWWLLAFALAGTDLLWCSMLGDVWFIAQTSAVAFGTLALAELAGQRRGALVALWTALAIGSRFTEVMALPVVAWWIYDGFLERDVRPRQLLAALAAFVPFVLLWIGYNLARWGVPWDAGHTIFYHQDAYLGKPDGSPFALANVRFQLWSFFVSPPHLSRTPPFVVPDAIGTAFEYTSPALLMVLFARRPPRLVLTLALAAVLVVLPSLLYYVNGGAQFGMRHMLDVLPFVLALMALAVNQNFAWFWRVLIAYSCIAGAYGCWYWNVYVRPVSRHL